MDRIAVLLVSLAAACIAPACAYPGPDGNAPAIVRQDSLSLEQCLEIAIENSNQIVISEGRVIKAQMGVKDARAGFLPELHLLGGYNVTDTFSSVEWSADHYSLSLAASISPFNGGRNIINTARSRESLSSAEQSRRLTEINLVLDVMARYYSLF